MDKSRLKQRIVGAIVLVALAVIFIPMILDGGRDELPIFTTNIPPQPEAMKPLQDMQLPKTAEPPPAVVSPMARIPIDEHSPKELPASPPTPLPDTKSEVSDAKPATGEEPKAWVVQVGSFGNRENALRMRDKLRDKHFAVFVERVTTKEGDVFRVRVGPEIRKTTAETMRDKLKRELKLDGVVMGHP